MIQPDIVVVTSIGSEHHRSFKTLAATCHEKAVIIRGLPATGVAVLNGDDPNVLPMKNQTKAKVITYGFDPQNDVTVQEMRWDWPRGMRLHLRGMGQEGTLHTRLIGRPMAYALLAASAVGLQEGFSLAQIDSALKTLTPTVGRLETVKLESGAHLIRDDFKGTMETIEAALDVLAEIPAATRLLILGKVEERQGSRGSTYRHVGALAGKVADRIIFVGTKSQAQALRSGAARAGLDREKIIVVSQAIPDALEVLPTPLNSDSVTLIKGRGSQRLDRIALALMGKEVQCNIKECTAKITRCHHCNLL
jgi:UDP-N-acetylmuramoyl-tripeptide--D-alanyl-D-alanine ligase